MTQELVGSDQVILDLLRKREEMTVSELSDSTNVTATAVRQRLTRLLAQGFHPAKRDQRGTRKAKPPVFVNRNGSPQDGSEFRRFGNRALARDPSHRRPRGTSRFDQSHFATVGDDVRGPSRWPNNGREDGIGRGVVWRPGRSV